MIALEEREAVMRASLALGDPRLAMTRTQRIAYRKLTSKRHPIFFLDCSRRWGKTRFLVLLSVCCAITTPGAIIRYCAPTKLHGRTFVIPAMDWVASLLPASKRPVFSAQDSVWVFPLTKARIYLGSAETIADADAQVGTECHLAVIDEAAKIRSEVLKHLHRSVLVHQFLTTRGHLVVGTTPPASPSHYVTREMLTRATNAGASVTFTIDDCDHISAEMKQEAIDECGGPSTPEARRELHCQHVPDRDWLVVPEWLDVRDECIREVEPAEYRDWYAAGDFGFEDLSVVLYAWFDFPTQTIVVEHEIVAHRESSLAVGHACKALEAAQGIKPLTRVADAPLQMLADLAHPTLGPGIAFALTQKDDSDAALAHMRNQIGRKRVVVHPRCTTLIAHLGAAVWNTNRTSFERMGGDFGHWDAIDALKYLNRAVNRRKNPEPIIPAGVHASTHFVHPDLLSASRQRQRVPLGRGGHHG